MVDDDDCGIRLFIPLSHFSRSELIAVVVERKEEQVGWRGGLTTSIRSFSP